MNKVLCSTGAIIGKSRDYTVLERVHPQLVCDGYEFMIYRAWYDRLEEVADYLIKNNFYIPVVHSEKSIGEKISDGGKENIDEAYRLFAVNCDFTKKLGAAKMVLHLWGGMTSDSNIENNYQAYKELNRISNEYGIDLLIENVVCNQKDPLTHWSELYRRYPEISLLFDTKMSAFHFQEEKIFEPEYSWLFTEKHIKHYHINDYAGGYKDWPNQKALPVGKGHVNFKKLFSFLKEQNYEGDFTIESPAFNKENEVDVSILNDGVNAVRNLIEGN